MTKWIARDFTGWKPLIPHDLQKNLRNEPNSAPARHSRERGNPFDAEGIILAQQVKQWTDRLDSRWSLCPRRRVRE